MKSINTPFVHFLLKLILVIYLVFRSICWNFNPGEWSTFERIISITIFLIYASTES